MIFPTHVMAPGTVTSFFKRPSVGAEFDMPAVHEKMSAQCTVRLFHDVSNRKDF
jgi:hypothetical protein